MDEVIIKHIDNIAAALPLVWDTFMEFEAPDYSEQGAAEFYNSIHDEDYLRQLSAYGAYSGDTLLGVIASRNEGAHIALFFVDGKYHRRGIGRKLFERLKADCTFKKMTVNSSPYAVGVYESFGFCPTDTVQTVNGIRFTPMKLILD